MGFMKRRSHSKKDFLKCFSVTNNLFESIQASNFKVWRKNKSREKKIFQNLSKIIIFNQFLLKTVVSWFNFDKTHWKKYHFNTPLHQLHFLRKEQDISKRNRSIQIQLETLGWHLFSQEEVASIKMFKRISKNGKIYHSQLWSSKSKRFFLLNMIIFLMFLIIIFFQVQVILCLLMEQLNNSVLLRISFWSNWVMTKNCFWLSPHFIPKRARPSIGHSSILCPTKKSWLRSCILKETSFSFLKMELAWLQSKSNKFLQFFSKTSKR